MPIQPTDEDRRDAAMMRAVSDLGEFFDSVQIMACHDEENISTASFRGTGSWYTRMGMVRRLLIEDDERTREEVRQETEDAP